MHDLRLAFRSLAKSPGFTVVAVLVLAVGIAASIVVFSAVKGILLRPLPFPDPERLVWIYAQHPVHGITGERLSPAEVSDIQSRTRAFSSVTAINGSSLLLQEGGRPHPLRGLAVGPELFDVLGVEPAAGRRLLASDGERSERVILISHEWWQSRFAGSLDAIGATLNFGNGMTRTIVGVLPAGLKFPLARAPQVGNGSGLAAGHQDFWVPLPPVGANASRAERFTTVVARLQPGVPPQTAIADLRVLGHALAAEFPATNAGREFTALGMREQILGRTGPALKILLGAVALVFLLACANVATLLLCRGLTRQPELALRAALGAGRGQILRQLLAESFVLSALGAVGGVIISFWSLEWVVKAGTESVPFLAQIRIDGPALLLAVGLALAAGMLAGIAPGWLFSQTNPQDALKSRSTGGTDTRRSVTWRNVLVIGQMALTVVFLCAAALLLRSFVRLAGVDLGYAPAPVLTTELDGIAAETRTALFQRLAQLPWVEAAGAVHSLPLTGKWSIRDRFGIPGKTEAGASDPLAALSFVGFDYFKVMGIRLLRGRSFTVEESLNLENAPVAVVSDSFARRYFPGEDALGQTILAPGTRVRRIVGIVKDTRDARPELAPEPQFYLPLVLGDMKLVVRTVGSAAGWSTALRAEIEAVAPQALIGAVKPMSEIVAGTRTERRFSLFLLTSFAGVALLLGSIGLHAVLVYSVAQRRREIGIRLAIGAQARDILRLVASQAGRLGVVGIGLGLVGAFGISRALQGLLYEIQVTDTLSYVAALLVLAVAALLALLVPALRAVKVDPIAALRAE